MLKGLRAWHSDSSFLDSNVGIHPKKVLFAIPYYIRLSSSIQLLRCYVFMLMVISQQILRIGALKKVLHCYLIFTHLSHSPSSPRGYLEARNGSNMITG